MANLGALIDAVELSYAPASDAAWLAQLRELLSPALEPRAVDAILEHACDVDGRAASLCDIGDRHGRLAVHLAAAARLRRYGGWMEAVLTPAGALCHAEGEAIYMREELREAARTIDRARTRLRVTSPEDALAGWRVLVEARWSLVDLIDSDGKRLLVARTNPPRTGASEVLAARERQVLALSRRGHPNRLIAYELGLSEGAIEAHLATALRKLGACA
jgi:ATP/maltotriose-dependent transcriptional regulator MalT